jgi:hypothetical protein
MGHNEGMPKPHLRTLLLTVLFSSGLAAWSPRFHEGQTLLAARLVPRGMAAFLLAHEADLRDGARGQGNDQVPVVEDVEDQFRLIVTLTEEGARPARLVRELGTLAHQVELLTDPSAVRGSSPLRETFESYADQEQPKLVLTREPFWALRAPLDPRPRLLAWVKTKYERHQVLLGCVDEQSGRRVGAWDDLSVPFAQLQLAYSNGVNATANLWIQLWRAVGDMWSGTPGE